MRSRSGPSHAMNRWEQPSHAMNRWEQPDPRRPWRVLVVVAAVVCLSDACAGIILMKGHPVLGTAFLFGVSVVAAIVFAVSLEHGGGASGGD